jgi:hypothetical protein
VTRWHQDPWIPRPGPVALSAIVAPEIWWVPLTIRQSEETSVIPQPYSLFYRRLDDDERQAGRIMGWREALGGARASRPMVLFHCHSRLGIQSARSSTRMRVRPSLTCTRRSQPTART